MDPVVIAVIVLIIVALAVIWWMMRRRKTEDLREEFGDEYDRTVEVKGDRSKAEADLEDRRRRVDALDIRPLTSEEREAFTGEWNEVKALFVDSPAEAVLHADRMLANMMKTRGFPMADFDRRYEDLTVEHGEVARHYREGHELIERQNRGEASTEDLRQAMKHYEVLFEELVSDVDEDVAERRVDDDRPRETVVTERRREAD